jgi:hypothetical protein
MTLIMSQVYPEGKSRKETKHDTEKPKVNQVKPIFILARSISEGKPDICGSHAKENAAQCKTRKTDRGFSGMSKFSMRGRSRLRLLRAFLERRIRDLQDYVQSCVAELVFNLDEVGISDREDGRTKKVIAPPQCLVRRYIMDYLEM